MVVVQDQEEATCACTAFATTGANAVKFAIGRLEHYHLVIIELICYYVESINQR